MAVLARGGQIEWIFLDAEGSGGTDLTINVGWFGSPVPKRAFIALVYALNAFGLAADDDDLTGSHDHYAVLDSFLNPVFPPLTEFLALRAAGKILSNGMPGLHRAIASGRYGFPRGMFFGGKRHEQCPSRFHLYISGRFSDSSCLAAIDVHTGLGRFGEDCPLVSNGQQRDGQDGMYFRMFPAAQVHFRGPGIRHLQPLSALPHCARRTAPTTTGSRGAGKSSDENTPAGSVLPIRQAVARTSPEAWPRSARPGISSGLRLIPARYDEVVART